MTRQEHLLAIAAEECAEIAQRCAKAQRFGMEQVQPQSHDDGRTDTSTNPEQLSNRQRIEKEYSHLVSVMEMLEIYPTRSEINAKAERVERYLEFSRTLGTLQGS